MTEHDQNFPEGMRKESLLRAYEGTYRGFMFTDESPSGMGEARMIISSEAIVIHSANEGWVNRREISLGEIVEVPLRDELQATHNETPEVKAIQEYSLGPGMNSIFFIDHDDSETPKVFLQGGPGLNAFYSAEQVENGALDRYLSRVEAEVGIVPRLPIVIEETVYPATQIDPLKLDTLWDLF